MAVLIWVDDCVLQGFTCPQTVTNVTRPGIIQLNLTRPMH